MIIQELENRWDMIYGFCSEIERVFYERQQINQPVRKRLSAMLERYNETKMWMMV